MKNVNERGLSSRLHSISKGTEVGSSSHGWNECICNGVVHAGPPQAQSKLAEDRGGLECPPEECGLILYSGPAGLKFWRVRADVQFKLLPLVVLGGVTRSLACLHQDGQGAVCGSPSNGRWSDWVQVGSQVGRWRS